MNTIASSVRLRLLLPAALIAGSAVLSGSAFEPVIACAAPNDTAVLDKFEACARGADNAAMDGKITDAQWDDMLEDCCLDAGGVWTPTVFPRCGDPQAVESGPDRGGVTPPTDAATLPPPTPRLPTVPQPSENATVAPPPAAPPTTSTFAPPPLR